MERKSKSELFERARRVLPGGVDSPVRSFRSVGGEPFFAERGEGSRIYDTEGRAYLDYVCSYGPLILGHAHPAVVDAIREQAALGTSFGSPTALEVDLAEAIIEAMPSIGMVRFVNSGTEATMSAIRVARAFTGRSKVIKCEGCYHGHADGFLSQAGSGLAALGISSSPGVPDATAGLTITIPFNDEQALAAALEKHGRDVAAFILEPVPANMGLVLPREGYLAQVRELTRKFDALLIFDEVITGFRLGYGGAQARFGVRADLTCLGKIIGGGLPVGAYGGREDIMRMVAPEGPVYQAGTLSGNPLAMRAGLETLRQLRAAGVYERLEVSTARLAEELRRDFAKNDWPVTANQIASLLTIFFTSTEVVDYASARSADQKAYATFFHEILRRGIFLPPSPFEALFISTAHTIGDLEETRESVIAAMAIVFEKRS